MADEHISPGFLTPSAAEYIKRAAIQTEQNRQKAAELIRNGDTADFPAVITSGAAGYHAWTEQAFGADGLRYTKPGGRTGTAAVNPAVLPDRSTISSDTVEVWLRRTLWNATYGIIYEVVSNPKGKAEFIRFALPGTLATTDASKASCTVDDFWGGTTPGATVTVYNLPASSNYMFSGLAGNKGLAVYDEIDNKYWIVQLQCTGSDNATSIAINSTEVIGGDTNGLIYTDGTAAQTASGTRITTEKLELQLSSTRWVAFSVGSY